MRRTTAEWVRKAEADYRAALRLGRAREPFHDQVCFHCQQATEKYLKALLEEAGLAVPRTHDLDRVLRLLSAGRPSLRPLRRGLLFLSGYAVEQRYPGKNATRRQAQAALRWAGLARTACRGILGIRPRPSKRKR